MPPSSRSSPMSSRSTAEHPAVSVHPTPVHFGDPFLRSPSPQMSSPPVPAACTACARTSHSSTLRLVSRPHFLLSNLLGPPQCCQPCQQHSAFVGSFHFFFFRRAEARSVPVPRYSSSDDDPVVMTRCHPLLSPLSLPPAAPPPLGPPPAAADQTFEVPPNLPPLQANERLKPRPIACASFTAGTTRAELLGREKPRQDLAGVRRPRRATKREHTAVGTKNVRSSQGAATTTLRRLA
ncbi:hypothetical protein BC826DRAFT_1191245 [Russula brevipes]|nr:hypothetical protein BC826DRAFT_1191245 [Russula brevipes]